MGINSIRHRYPREEYKIGLICELPLEATAVSLLLDEQHRSLPQPASDTNSYTLGILSYHKVVIVCPQHGAFRSAADIFQNLKILFPSLCLFFHVGIGSGAPSELHDIRLGDVVIGVPSGNQHAVIELVGNFRMETRDTIVKYRSPPSAFISSARKLEATHLTQALTFKQLVEVNSSMRITDDSIFAPPPDYDDVLFRPEYAHVASSSGCAECDTKQIIRRKPRHPIGPRIHCGSILSTSSAIKNGVIRTELQRKFGVLCFEMEAAGLQSSLPVTVIRGICDYADSHKDSRWQSYAAATAAACTRLLLADVQPDSLTDETLSTNDSAQEESFSIPARNEKFYGRETILDKVDFLLRTLSCVVLTGMGGVGKTQIAIEAAHRWKIENPQTPVLWIGEPQSASWTSQFQAHLAFFENSATRNEDSFIELRMNESRLFAEDERWLMILDNLDDSLMPTGLQKYEWFPKFLNRLVASLGRDKKLLVTSRSPPSTFFVDQMYLEVKPVSVVKGAALLRFLLQNPQPQQYSNRQSKDIYYELSHELVGLPLALASAANFMIESQTTPDHFLEWTGDLKRNLRRHKGAQREFLPTLLLALSESARDLLRMVAAFGYDTVPEILLAITSTGLERSNETIKSLAHYALIEWDSSVAEVSVDRVFCDLILRTSAENDEKLAIMAAQILVLQLPKIVHETERIIQRTMAITKMILSKQDLQRPPDGVLPRASFLYVIGYLLWHRYHEMRAVEYASQAYEIFVQDLGRDFRSCLNALKLKTSILLDSDRLREAEQCCLEMLHIAEMIFGEEHPRTLSILHTYAVTLRSCGKLVEAEKVMVRVCNWNSRYAGSEHPESIAYNNDLGKIYLLQGKFKEAESIFTEVVSTCEKLLGPNHPDTLTSMNNLLSSFRYPPVSEAARSLAEEVSERSQTSLGLDHPNTLTSLNNLAVIYSHIGRSSEAISVSEQALGVSERTGNTLMRQTILVNLARIWYDKGELDQAEATYKTALELLEKTLGPDHATTINCMCSLAVLLEDQGKLRDALLLLDKICDAITQSKGESDSMAIKWKDHRYEVREKLDSNVELQRPAAREMRSTIPIRKAGAWIAPAKQALRLDDVIILVMGLSGAGKSSFISLFTSEKVPIGHFLESCTKEIRVYRSSLLHMRNLVLIDTPGADFSDQNDVEVLEKLARFLVHMYSNDLKLTGIIYLHRITTSRFSGSAMRDLRMLEKVCGKSNLGHVVFATTFWLPSDYEQNRIRENKLVSTREFWGQSIAHGAKVFRHDNTRISGEAIIQFFYPMSKIVLRIQEEIVDEGKSLYETKAGMEVVTEVMRLKQHDMEQLKLLQGEMQEALESRNKVWESEISKYKAALEAKIEERERDLQLLKGFSKDTVTASTAHGKLE